MCASRRKGRRRTCRPGASFPRYEASPNLVSGVPASEPPRPSSTSRARLRCTSPLTSYSHFDGTTWREQPCCDRHFPAEPEPHGTWLRLSLPPSPCFGGAVVHQVKIGTLESSSMPVPAHPFRFRVGSVNRLDFFGWAQFGIIRMTDRTVPAGTIIDSEARTVDPARIASMPFPARPYVESDHELAFQGEYMIDPAVAALARAWVNGLPEGWRQVEAVIAALRRGYSHDRSATAAPDCQDVVAEFLLRSGRGPDYLFASSAVVLLRSLGYPTRLVSGLYAAPSRYDPRTRHTPVTSDDVHFWAEVRLPGGRWVAVEPTPGYEVMPPVRTWAEQIARALLTVSNWAVGHAAGLLAAMAGLGVLVIRRRDVLDRLATLAFILVPVKSPRGCVMRALETHRTAQPVGGPPASAGSDARSLVSPARMAVCRRNPHRTRGARPPRRLVDPRTRRSEQCRICDRR